MKKLQTKKELASYLGTEVSQMTDYILKYGEIGSGDKMIDTSVRGFIHTEEAVTDACRIAALKIHNENIAFYLSELERIENEN